MENRKLKVFLCHSKNDIPEVRKLYKRLIADGFDAWLDEEKLMPGQDWDLEIQKAVRNSDTIIVCLSNNSVTKEGYVQKEIGYALDIAGEKPEGTIFLIPLRLEECNVPTRVSRYQWVDIFKKTGYTKLKESLRLRMDDLKIRFDKEQVFSKNHEDTIRIPILGSISTDALSVIPQPSENYLSEDSYEFTEVNRNLFHPNELINDLYALVVTGDGMMDALLNNGDIIVLKAAKEARNGEMVVIRIADNYILRYFYRGRNRYRLQPANPEIRPIYVKHDEPIEIKGKVVMVIRSVKAN